MGGQPEEEGRNVVCHKQKTIGRNEKRRPKHISTNSQFQMQHLQEVQKIKIEIRLGQKTPTGTRASTIFEKTNW
jgi:hypothetical protein